MTFTVGFDLDMTLIDPRPGMVEIFRTLAAESGLPLDGEAFVSRLGPPLSHEFARYRVTPERNRALVARYRELYPRLAIQPATAMPGAIAAVQRVAELGGRSVVVTAKFASHARGHLDALGLSVEAIAGELWSVGKAVALRAEGAEIYVGDHLGDITAAREADALSVAVATGPIPAELLRAAGADVVLTDLTRFPEWLEGYLRATVH